jgi:hypothetical protein
MELVRFLTTSPFKRTSIEDLAKLNYRFVAQAVFLNQLRHDQSYRTPIIDEWTSETEMLNSP